MHPRLLTTPFFTLHTFGALLALAYLAALWWLRRGASRAHVDVEAASSLGFWAIGGAIVGAKALMIARDFGQYAAAPSEIVSRSTLSAAGDFYGGFIGALVASAIFFRRHPELPAWRVADLCGPAIALGQTIGRIGCFMAGDDYGRPTDLPWAVAFTDVDAGRIGGAPLGVPLHPVQLYESFVCLLIFVALVRLRRRKRFDGEAGWHDGTTENISRSGVLFRGAGILRVDTPIEMRLVLPVGGEVQQLPELLDLLGNRACPACHGDSAAGVSGSDWIYQCRP